MHHRRTGAHPRRDRSRCAAPGARGLDRWRRGGPGAVRLIRAHCPDTTVRNGYGPTEATVVATSHPATGEGPTEPLGRPLDNTRALVLDARLRPVRSAASASCYLAGGLARGYVARPAETAHRFLADPYGPPGSRCTAPATWPAGRRRECWTSPGARPAAQDPWLPGRAGRDRGRARTLPGSGCARWSAGRRPAAADCWPPG
ncbi:AMP-binding protein [Streptacidiphilus sp. 4-A2]|nr:AMP-binding protein [Streptacidiphilus sp. 4-A2]